MFDRILKISGIGLVTTFALAISASEAQAILLGDDVRLQFGVTESSPIFDQTATVIDPGVEFTIPLANPLPVDVRGNSFDIQFDITGFPNVGELTTFILSDLDWIDTPGIVTGVALTSGDISQIVGTSFTDDSITIDFLNLNNPPAVQTFSFDIETSHSTSVPFEFSPTLGILILGGVFGICKLRARSCI